MDCFGKQIWDVTMRNQNVISHNVEFTIIAFILSDQIF